MYSAGRRFESAHLTMIIAKFAYIKRQQYPVLRSCCRFLLDIYSVEKYVKLNKSY